MYERSPYYCWRDIENRRLAMLHAPKLLHVEDFGTGSNRNAERLVMDIAKTSLEQPRYAQLLFRWLSYMGQEQRRKGDKAGLHIMELGTSLGITTAYLAMADRHNEVITFEGSHEILDMAKRNWEKLGIDNIRAVEGNIDVTLEETIKEYARSREPYYIDMAYLDANHTYEATMRYWHLLQPLHKENSIYVIDDICYSPEMNRAWREIQNDPSVTSTMNIFHMGIVFFDSQYLKRHYKLRY